MSENTFTYPSKVQKFGIQQIHLKFIVAKYENEIPWQSVVKNEETLIAFVKSTLLPNLIRKAKWPLAKGQEKHFFITEKHLNLDHALGNEHELNSDEYEMLKKIHSEKGEHEARIFLSNLINKNKSNSFKKWIQLFNKEFPNNEAFQLLVLRPMFESTGYGNRRNLSEPSLDIIDWMDGRMKNSRITPKSNLAREYFIKSTFGSGEVIYNGWQLIRCKSPGPKLTSAARGSGWCIADNYYAKYYIKSFDFYILRSAGKPVVALRVNPINKTIIECRGTSNSYPEHWISDIYFFTQSLNLVNTKEIQLDMNKIDFDKSNEWWRKRLQFWPFIQHRLPENFAKEKPSFELKNISNYLEFFSLNEIKDKLDLNITYEDVCNIISLRPDLYDALSKSFAAKETLEFQKIALNATLEIFDLRRFTANEFQLLPNFIKEHELFLHKLGLNFPKELTKKLERTPRNWGERASPSLLADYIPYSQNESIKISITRAVNLILTHKDSDFSDNMFPEEMRNSKNFNEIRETAWVKAIKKDPTYYFALPHDLRARKIYEPLRTVNDEKLLNHWISSIESRPWHLNVPGYVPKEVRYHEKLLGAYITGWVPRLMKTPSRIYHVFNNGWGTRTYMSYPALKNKFILNALIEGFQKNPGEFNYTSSNHVKNYQMAWLIAGFRSNSLNQYMYYDRLKEDTLKNGINASENDEDPTAYFNVQFFKGNQTLLVNAYSGLNSATILKLDTTPPTTIYVAPIKASALKKMPTSITKGSLLEIVYNGRKMLISIDVDKTGYVTFTSNQLETKLLKGTRIGGSFKIGSHTIELIDILG